MKCITCGKGLEDGISLYRQNEFGIDGIWACLEHDKTKVKQNDPDTVEITEIIAATNRKDTL